MRVLAFCLSMAAFAAILPPDSNADTSLRRLRVLTWDVNAGRTAAGSAGLDGQLDALWAARPDVVALQNVTPDLAASIEGGLETRSTKNWTASYQSDTADAASVGSVILTWLPVDAVFAARLPASGSSRTAAAVAIRVTVNSWPVVVSTARLDEDDASNRSTQLQQWQQWLDGQPARRVAAGNYAMEPTDAAWPAWRAAYGDAWQNLVFSSTQEFGWTVDARPASNKPGRTDYQWYAQLNPTEVFLTKSAASTHHALVVDYEVR